MRQADLAEVARLESELFAGESWSEDLLAAELRASQASDPDRVYLVAEHSDADRRCQDHPRLAGSEEPENSVIACPPASIIGYAGLWHGGIQPAQAADLLTIATMPAARRRGVARALLARLIDAAREVGCQCVMLEVRESNTAAQQLYSTMGFLALPAKRRRYYINPVEDAIIMRLQF